MPSWVPKAIALFWLGFVMVDLVEGLLVALRTLLIALLVSLFLSFAIEPAVNALARRGWRRGAATGLVFLIILLVAGVFVFAIGSVVVNQVRNFVDEAPAYVDRIQNWVNDTFNAHVDFNDLADRLNDPNGPARNFVSDLAGSALKAGITAISVIFQIFTIALFTFYMVADGPRLRRTICSAAAPPTAGVRPAGVGARDREDRELPLLPLHPRGAVDRVPLDRARDPRRARTRSRSRCGSASSRSSSPSSGRTSRARSRCWSRS